MSSACLSDDELAELATNVAAHDTRLPHIEACDTCRAIWLHAREAEEPPWAIGRYQVRGTLGAGGLGVVLLGWDPVLQREVAIKFPSTRAGDHGVLLREAQALAAIRHRNVVAVHDFGEIDGDVYFTMERVAGVAFDSWWLGATTAQRLRAVIEVAEGLAAIHAAGLVHCDIKPDNIVVTQAGDPVIVDLGLATTHGEEVSGGTPGYRAPEVERGDAPTSASDEYAFWCVVRHGFANAELSSRKRRLLDALISRGTNSDPAARFGSMTAGIAALRRIAAPRRWIALAVALAGTAAIAATVAAVARGGDDGGCNTELAGWSGALRDGIANQLAARPAVAARVTAFVDRERATGRALLERACEAAHSDDAAQRAAALRTQWCVASSWDWIAGHVDAIAHGRDVARSLDELPMGIPAERCAPGGVTASPPAVDVDATPASRELYADLLRLEGLLPAEKLVKLGELGNPITAANNAALTAAWHFELADTYRTAGKYAEATTNARAAMDVATRNGDDLVLARARLAVYILHDARTRGDATSDREVEAIVERVGSPGLLATFHDAAAQRAINAGDIARARTLLERSIASTTALELAPSRRRGASEQNLGVALQFSGQLDEAQRHFERAVEVFTDRVGAGDEVTSGARLSAGHNLVYLGKVDEGAAALDALAAELASSNRTSTAVGARVAFARCQAEQAVEAKGTRKRALERCREALATSREVFGKAPDVVTSLLAVSQLTMRTSVRDAIPLLEEAIGIAEQATENPTDLPYARGLYALALKETGKAARAEAIAKLAIADLERFGQRDLVAELRKQFPKL